jgi:agmatine/peptidylarginine deiminase
LAIRSIKAARDAMGDFIDAHKAGTARFDVGAAEQDNYQIYLSPTFSIIVLAYDDKLNKLAIETLIQVFPDAHKNFLRDGSIHGIIQKQPSG